MDTHAFTTVNETIQNRLINSAVISINGKSKAAKALWDTGATCSCVSKEVARELGLIATSKVTINTPSGASDTDVYMVDILLPNRVAIEDVTVCGSEIGDQGIDLLIGMDIISQGDFAVSNYHGKTTFSFRMPSQKKTDYVQELRLRQKIGPTHGKGKRKKKR